MQPPLSKLTGPWISDGNISLLMEQIGCQVDQHQFDMERAVPGQLRGPNGGLKTLLG